MRTTLRNGALLAGVLAMCTGLGGCAAFSDAAPGRADDQLRVAAGFYPLQYVAARVAGGAAEVDDLTQPGQEPHDLELSPYDTAVVASADLVVYERGLQASVDAAVDQNAGGDTLDVGPVAGLEPLGHDGHDHVDDQPLGLGTADTDLGDLDPHFWLDPLKLAEVGDAVAARLSRIDPAHARRFADRAAGLREDLERVDEAYADGLASCERDTVVVSHNAFGYLTRYGLDIEPIAGLSPDAEPTPADLGRLQQLIRTQGVTTVFGERLVSPRLSRTLADDLGITTAVLDPIEGLTDETTDEDYVSLMQENLSALRLAGGCR